MTKLLSNDHFKLKKLLNRFNNKGSVIDKGAIYVVVILTLLIFGGYIFVGGNMPTKLPKLNTELVEVIYPSNYPSLGALQMHTIYGVTFTPAPTIIPPPTTPPDGPVLVECGRKINGPQDNTMMWGFTFDTTPAGQNVAALKVFYTAKNALILGSGAISPLTKSPDQIINPSVGDLLAKDSDNVPLFPALYITEISALPNAVAGDVQSGGQPNKPSIIYGTWKPVGSADPKANNTNLGPNADSWPAANGPGGPHDSIFTSELVWKVSDMQALNPGTSQYINLRPKGEYRIQIILHEGSNPTKIGVACVKLILPGDPPPPPPPFPGPGAPGSF